jgi:hypothetical protein
VLLGSDRVEELSRRGKADAGLEILLFSRYFRFNSSAVRMLPSYREFANFDGVFAGRIPRVVLSPDVVDANRQQ